MNELKLLMRAQAVAYHSDIITRSVWFDKFHPEVDLTYLEELFCKNVKAELTFISDLSLVNKCMFNSEKAPKFTKWLMKKDDLHPKAMHMKAQQEKDLQVASTIRKIIHSNHFVSLYSLKVCFSPNYEHSQNTRIQTKIKKVIATHK